MRTTVRLLDFLCWQWRVFFTWNIESFVDSCFDVVSFVTVLTKKLQKFISALFKIVIGGADTANY